MFFRVKSDLEQSFFQNKKVQISALRDTMTLREHADLPNAGAGRPTYCEDHTMERAGLKLKRTRERLKLTYREVEEASQQIAEHFGNSEFAIALSRLADIENKGTVPSIYRLYALCAIYRLAFDDVLAWYGAP